MNRLDIVLITLTAVCLILSFPPFLGGPVAMVCLVPLLYFIDGKAPRKAFFGGYFAGFIWTIGTLYWIGWATLTGLIGAVLYIPLFLAFTTLITNYFVRLWGKPALWLTPIVWTSLEYLQSIGPLGFPWNQMANTQTQFISWIQFASVTGPFAVTFWLLYINVLIYWFIQFFGKNNRTILAGLGIFITIILPWLHGNILIKKANQNGHMLNVALVQGNIDPYQEWSPSFVDSNLNKYQQLTIDDIDKQQDLFVWPETATPCYLRYRYRYLTQVRSISETLKASILTGSPDYEWNSNGKAISYNAAFLIQPGIMEIQRYYKMRLVPFSERVPLVDKLPFFYEWLSKLNLEVGNYASGDSIHVFDAKTNTNQEYRFGTAICFDSVFPFHVREFVRRGAQFLVIITNDGWFGHTSGPYQHAQIAVMRAIENRRYIIRCANTGISGFIDPWGRYLQKSPFNHEAVLNQTIYLSDQNTFYVKHGQWFHRIILLLAIIITAFAIIQKSKFNFFNHKNNKYIK